MYIASSVRERVYPQPHCIGKLATVRQDRECWVVAQGRSITGPVAVWRSPVVGPADLQIWTARPWPKDKWAIPNNCIVCSTRGPGLTALGGGDYDGDTVFVSANVFLLNYLDATEAAVRAMATADAARVKEPLAEDARTPWEAGQQEPVRGQQGPARGQQEASTKPARGQQEASKKPARGQQEAKRPARSQQEASKRPASGQQEAGKRPARSQQEASSKPARGQQEASKKPARSQQEASKRPARGPKWGGPHETPKTLKNSHFHEENALILRAL